MWLVSERFLLRVLLGLHVHTLQFLKKLVLIILTSSILRDFRLLLPSLSWNRKWCRLVFSCRCFGTICRAHLKGQEVLCLILELGTIGCPETSVTPNILCITFQRSQDFLILPLCVSCVRTKLKYYPCTVICFLNKF
jgi:hypothetical protein